MQKTSSPHGPKSVGRDDLCSFLADTLTIRTIADYSCNGLQVEGAETVSRVALAVDACMESFSAAVENGCQFILAHHGIIWGGITSVSGPVGKQVRYLIGNNCNLYAAHLPLDLHPLYGNNAVLAGQLNLHDVSAFGMYKGIPIGYQGKLKRRQSLQGITDTLNRVLSTTCATLPFGSETIHTIGIVSGGGSDALGEAIEKKLDCFITGESTHENYHAAREAGINVIYAGHYHTEKGGVIAMGKQIEQKFGIETCFLDLPTTL